MNNAIKITSLICLLCGIFVFSSCSEPYPEKIELEKFMYLSLSETGSTPILKTMDLDKDNTISLFVLYAGTTNYNQGEIIVEIAVDDTLVNSYNADHKTEYLPLPEGTFSFDKSSIKIEDGNSKSEFATITIKPGKINFAHEYLLPVTIKSATGSKIPINEELKTTYFLIKGNIKAEPSVDKWTEHEVSSTTQPEFSLKNIWDGVRNTYWQSASEGMPQQFAVNMDDYMLIEGFTWLNRQDNIEMAPKHVKFETSMNGTDWIEVLDVPEMPKSVATQVLELPEKTVARYFKVTILSNWSDAPYTCIAEVCTWAEEKPIGDYDWEKNTWEVIDLSSEWSNTTWAVKNIFDGDKNTTWHSDPSKGMPQWFIVDMLEKRPAIKGFLIWNRQNDKGSEPKNIVFSISDDGNEWTQILELKEMSNDRTEELDYKTQSSVSGQYLKVEVKTTWSGGGFTYIGEITPY